MVVRTVCSPVALRVRVWAATGHMCELVLCSHLRVRKRVHVHTADRLSIT